MKLLILTILFITSCAQESQKVEIKLSSSQKLYEAIAASDYEALERRERYDDLNVVNEEGTTALLDVILDYSEIGNPHRLETIKKMISHGADVNFQSKHTELTPLRASVQNNDLEVVKILLEAGADTKVLYSNVKRTALMLAISLNYNEIAQELYPHSPLEVTDKLGQTHIELAEKNQNQGYLDFVKNNQEEIEL